MKRHLQCKIAVFCSILVGYACLFTDGVFAQATVGKIMNTWTIPHNRRLTFNADSTYITGSCQEHGFGEGGACIGDVNGNFLFYTNGSTIWDRRDTAMPNGKDVTGFLARYPLLAYTITSSTTQGAVIVAFPDDPDKYYVFSLTRGEDYIYNNTSPTDGRLFYSVVDMKLNNGFGDVVPGKGGILIDSIFSENMTVVKGDSCNSWLVLQKRDSLCTFLAYSISAAGVNTSPVVSSNPAWIAAPGYSPGVIKISHDRKKAVVAHQLYNNRGSIAVYDFNTTTGIFSNELVLHFTPPLTTTTVRYQESYYGAAFSPDNTKIYATYYNEYLKNGSGSTASAPYFLVQFDLSSAAPPASRKTLGNAKFADIRLGPDGRIYFIGSDASGVGQLYMIKYPNVAGPNCIFTQNVVTNWPAGTGFYAGLPNDVLPVSTDTLHQTNKSNITYQQDMVLHAPIGYQHYIWDDGSTDSVRTVNKCGTYSVQSSLYGCYEHHVSNDTFVIYYDPEVNIGKIDISCSDNSRMWATPTVADAVYNYEWRNANNEVISKKTDKQGGDTVYNPEKGTYYITVSRIGCEEEYSIAIENASKPIHLVNISNDTTIIYEENIRLYAEAEGAVSYSWSPGTWLDDVHSNTPLASPENNIIYTVMAANEDGCIDTASVRIYVDRGSKEWLPSVFSPNGDGKNDVFRLLNIKFQELLEFKVFNRWGENIFTTNDVKGGWDGTYNGTPSDIGVYFYLIRVREVDGKEITYVGDVTLVR